MNKNDSHKISDEQIECIAKTVLRSTILTDEETEEIADAPQLWRKLQASIGEEKARRAEKRVWIFSGWNWRAAALAFGALAIVSIFAASILISNSAQTEVAEISQESEIIAPTERLEASPAENKTEERQSTEAMKPLASSSSKTAERKKLSVTHEDKTATKPAAKFGAARVQTIARKARRIDETEMKAATEFIALSYLPESESGQIVSVKVPRSMMVALGVTTDTRRSAELVKAEIVLGDDGAARAIRFIKD